jgi:hypothetical protein
MMDSIYVTTKVELKKIELTTKNMESSRFINICFLVFCASLIIPTRSHSYSHVALFIFGDSLYDVGNNNYLKNALARVNIKPYGETFFKYPTGRASDGRLIPDFVGKDYT